MKIKEIMEISENTKKYLQTLAQKYETACFSEGDPSCVLKKYSRPEEIEVMAFVMALFSFGQRPQFLKKVENIMQLAGKSPVQWLKDGHWKKDFPPGTAKYYRFYSYDDVRCVFQVLQSILITGVSFGEYVKCRYFELPENSRSLAATISEIFAGCSMVSHTKQSANKRLHMYFRWMVRRNSPVDAGLWTWFSPADLIIPLDIHVLQQARDLGLVPEKATASAKTALQITSCLKQIWPDDPCKGDFALFGLGVDSAH